MSCAPVELGGKVAVVFGGTSVIGRAIAPGVFRTALDRQLLDDTERGRERLPRKPTGRFGGVDTPGGAAVFLASDASRFDTVKVIAVGGGLLAGGVNK